MGSLNNRAIGGSLNELQSLIIKDLTIEGEILENVSIVAGKTIDGKDVGALTPDTKEFEWSGGTGGSALSNSTENYCIPDSGYNPDSDKSENIMPVKGARTITSAIFYVTGTPDNGGGVQKYVFTLQKGTFGSLSATTVTEEVEELEQEITVTGLSEAIADGQYVTMHIHPDGTPLQRKASWTIRGTYD